jgi:hypothetical protein
MMKKKQVVLNLRGLSVPEKVAKAKSIAVAMTNNPNFANPKPSPAEILAAAAELEMADSEVMQIRDASVTKTAVRSQKDEALDLILSASAGYVEGESKGDEAKIKSAGMDVKANATPIGIPAMPAALKASEGAKTGIISLKWKAVRGAKSYLVRSTDTIADNASWKQVAVVTKSAADIDALVSGKHYWFQVSAVGAAGQGAWSDPAVKVAP